MLHLFLILYVTLVLASPKSLHQQPGICEVPQPLFLRHTEVCVPPKVHTGQHESSTENSSAPRKVWKAGGLCRGARAGKFCVFTNPYFNKGEGVSVITTGDSMATIATRSAFIEGEGTEATESDPESNPPYREVEIPGKDIGLVATRKIRMGELIVARTPALMVNEKAIQALGKKMMSELLARASDNLPAQHREVMLNLSTHTTSSDYGDKLYKILQTNSFRTGYHDGENPFYSLFTEVSRMNHDCRPTCAYYFDHIDFHQKVLAVRDIEPGEELTIAYYDPLQTHSVRQQKLQKEWGFKCSCQRCSADVSSILESDDRVSQIHALWKELDDHSASSKGSTEKAELLISLYEQEGILGRLNEAYYRAALEYIGVGNIEMATKYAKMTVDHGRLFIGPDRPFITNMLELIANPTGHPKWKFRLKDA